VKFKPLLTAAASGKLGGIVFSHNSGGMYTRQFRVPTNPNTAFQQEMRNITSQLQGDFRTVLDQTQRDAWAVFAQNVGWVDTIGDVIKLSAQNWYIKANSIRLQGSLRQVNDAPTVFALASITPPTVTIAPDASSVQIAFNNADEWANSDDGALLVYASRPQNNTVNFFNGPYRFAGSIAGDATTPPTSPQSISLPFASGPVGSKVFLRFVGTNGDGRPSASFRVDGIVA